MTSITPGMILTLMRRGVLESLSVLLVGFPCCGFILFCGGRGLRINLHAGNDGPAVLSGLNILQVWTEARRKFKFTSLWDILTNSDEF